MGDTYNIMASVKVTESREDSQMSENIKSTFIFIVWLIVIINKVLVGLLGNSKCLSCTVLKQDGGGKQ